MNSSYNEIGPEQSAAILSTFYPIGAVTTESTNTTAAMEPSELTKRLMMNQRSSDKTNDGRTSMLGGGGGGNIGPPVEGQGGDGPRSPLSAGQASAAAAAHQKDQLQQQQQQQQPPYLDQDKPLSSSLYGLGSVDGTATTPLSQRHPTSAALIQAAAVAAASSVANATTSSLNDMVEREKQSRRRKDFPWKLHCMLEEAETFNNQHIVSWMPDGRSFRVFQPDEFVARIMPHYFHQTQYRSFQRMLNLYDFTKVVTGPNRGAYHHPMFLRRDREMCLQMRIRKRSSSKKAKKSSEPAQSDRSEEPQARADTTGGRTTGNRSQTTTDAPTGYSFSQEQPQQAFAVAPGVDMEGLFPMFQQPLVNAAQMSGMIQQESQQYQNNQLQQQDVQKLQQLQQQHNQLLMQQQQLMQVPDESPLTSRRIHTLDFGLFNARPLTQSSLSGALPSTHAGAVTNTPPSSLGFLPSTWKTAVTHRSLLSSESNNDEQRVNLSPPTVAGRDGVIRNRLDGSEYGIHPDESKASNSALDDVKAMSKAGTTATGGPSANSQFSSNPVGFQVPLHFDLEPTPLPPRNPNN